MTELHYVHLESSTHCNAKCRMCPHSQISRRGMMEYDLFTGIVDQAMDLGCKAFNLFRLGEPLLFPHLFDWMDYLKEKGAVVGIYTNGANLTPEIGARLKEYADMYCDFVISFHGYNEETYRDMMGLDFNLVYNRIKDFMKDNPISAGIYMLANDTTDQHISDAYNELFGDMGFKGIGICNFMEWAGNIEGFRTFRTMVEEGAEVETHPCIRILNEIDVMYDGTVCLCCLDAHGEITFGNLNTMSLEQVLDHKLRRYYQEKHLANQSDELPLCKFCSTKMVIR